MARPISPEVAKRPGCGCLPTIEAARVALFGDHKPADSVIGAEALFPGYLIEVEAIAVVDG